MGFVNPPEKPPLFVRHETLYSHVLNHETGFNIYLPPDYKGSGESFPVTYHIHGWKGNESTEIWPLEKVYRNRRAITVFINAISTEEGYFDALLQIESLLIHELLPHIEGRYGTDATRDGRMLSGFSMGGNMAFYYAVKHPELFGAVTSYAGTFHHLYNKEYRTVGVPPEKAGELFDEMMREKWYLEENNILSLVRQNVEKIRGKLSIDLHIGTADILFCDNVIMHLYLESLNIPHAYRTFEGIEHELEKIL
jgi:enterochelin esterase-like enzyme